MAVLHPVRDDPRRRVRSRFIAALALAGVLAGCDRDAPLELQPDLVLRELLGLDSRDAVHVVQLRGRGSAEVAEPARMTIEQGHWIDFRGGDARGHVVRFDTLALGAEARRWIREADQVESPPLLTPASRWVVSFEEAPAGSYPFEVEGGGTTGTGQIEVAKGER